MGESSILTDGEPVRLVCLSVHHKNIGMFMRHTTSKLMFPLPLHNANSHRKRGRRFGNDSQADIFVQLPTPGQRREYSSDKRRFRGSIKAEIRRFFAKKHTSAPHFPAWGRGFNRRLTKSFSRIGSFLCEREPRFSRWAIVLQLPKMFPLLRGH